MAGTEVITYRSTDTGAPTLPIGQGGVISVLDACLKDGYNTKTPSGITRSGATATVSFATAHGYASDGATKVQLSGWTQTEYNGIFKISNVTANTFDITVTGSPATPGTGSPTAKVPPLGWTKPFSSAGLAAYRSSETLASKLYLRIDDNNPNADTYKSAMARGYETMSDVNTGTAPFPTVAQMALGVFINKAYLADTGNRNWLLFGDGYEFHFFYTHYVTANPSIFKHFHFGDPCSELTSDPYGCLILGDNTIASASNPESNSTTQQIVSSSGSLAAQTGHYYARIFSQDGGSVGASKHGNVSVGSQIIGGGTAALNYPSQTNNALYIAPLYASDGSVLRAQMKGVYQPLHPKPLGHGTIRPAAQSPIGRRLFAVATGYSGSTPGEIHVDIDGPWR